MKLISARNFILFLAAILVIAFGVMSLNLQKKKDDAAKMKTPNITAVPTLTQTDNIQDIESDLDSTELDNMDQELNNLDTELNKL